MPRWKITYTPQELIARLCDWSHSCVPHAQPPDSYFSGENALGDTINYRHLAAHPDR
jgi:hypothetical protein